MSFSGRLGLRFSSPPPQEGCPDSRRSSSMNFPAKLIRVMGSFSSATGNGSPAATAREKHNHTSTVDRAARHGQSTYSYNNGAVIAIAKPRRLGAPHALPPGAQRQLPVQQQHSKPKVHELERKILTRIPDFDDTFSDDTHTSSEGDYRSSHERGSEASSYMTASTSASLISLPLTHCPSTQTHSHSHTHQYPAYHMPTKHTPTQAHITSFAHPRTHTHSTPTFSQYKNSGSSNGHGHGYSNGNSSGSGNDTANGNGYGNGYEYTSLPPPPRKNVKRPVITSEPTDPSSETLCLKHACPEPCFVCEPPRWTF